jgi:WD40 repeat protein
LAVRVFCLLLASGWLAGGDVGAADKTAAPRTDLYDMPLPANALVRCGAHREQNHGKVGRVAFSPDGRFLATANGPDVCLWDVATGKSAGRFSGHTSPVLALAFADGGKELISFGDNTLRAWSVTTGKELRQTPHADFSSWLVSHVVIAADGRTLAVPDGRLLRLWDVAAGKDKAVIRGSQPTGLAFSADGKTLAAVGEETRDGKRTPVFQTWEVDREAKTPGRLGKELTRLEEPGLLFVSVALSSNGETAATVAWVKDKAPKDPNDAGTYVAHLWDLKKKERGSQLLEVRKVPLLAAVFAPDDKTLVVADSMSKLHVCDVKTARETQTLQADGSFPVLAFSADGKLLASSTSEATVQLWDVATGKSRSLTETHRSGVTAVAFSADGRTVASGSNDGSVLLWEAATGRPLRRLTVSGGVSALAITPDGRHLLTDGRAYGKGVALWEAATGRERPLPSGDDWRVAGFSADGTTLALSGHWPRKGSDTPPRPAPARSGVGLFRDGGELLGFVLEVARRAELRSFRWVAAGRQPQPAISNRLAGFLGENAEPSSGFDRLSPDGTVLVEIESRLAGSPDTNMGTYWMPHRVRLLDAATGDEIGSLPARAGQDRLLALSPDGRTVATGDDVARPGGRATLTLWETAGGKDRLPVRTPAAGAAFSGDGRLLATCDGYQAFEVWDALTGDSLARFEVRWAGNAVLAFSPDGTTLASGLADGTVLIWDLKAALAKRAAGLTPLQADQLDSLWASLADRDGVRAYRALAALARDPRQSVPFLAKQLAVADVAARVKELVGELDSNSYSVRQQASEELERLNERARGDLVRALAEHPTAEQRRRIERVLEKLGAPLSSAEGVRLRRSVEALERMSTPAARELLEKLADAPATDALAQEAQRTLRRLKRLGSREP